MRFSSIMVVAFGLFGGSVHFAQDKTTDSQTSTDWKKDPVCRAVFDGVLEGLHRDRVSADIVANIIGKTNKKKDRKTLRDRMKRSFVLDCPLCEPTFEAFLAYQNGKPYKTGKKPQTKSLLRSPKIKPALTPEEKKKLLSDDTKTRLQGLAPVVQKWVSIKLASHTELTEKEISDWKKRVHARSDQGKSKLIKLITKTGSYKEWSPYWGCAACNGSRDAASKWKTKSGTPTGPRKQ